MDDVKTATKDPVCGMNVAPSTAVHAERDGERYYFCSDYCRRAFLAKCSVTKPLDNADVCSGAGGCVG